MRLQDDVAEPSSVRDWAEGDPLKRIHWALTMKTYDPLTGEWNPQIKTYDEAVRPDLLILPDLSRPKTSEEEARTLIDALCDAALSVCASAPADQTVRLVLLEDRLTEVSGTSNDGSTDFALALAKAHFDTSRSFDTLASEAMRRLGTTGAAVFVISSLTEKNARSILRLRAYSGLRICVVTTAGNALSDPMSARLEASDILLLPFVSPEKEGSA